MKGYVVKLQLIYKNRSVLSQMYGYSETVHCASISHDSNGVQFVQGEVVDGPVPREIRYVAIDQLAAINVLEA